MAFIPDVRYFVCGKQKQKLEICFCIVRFCFVRFAVLRFAVLQFTVLEAFKPLFPLTASRLSRKLVNGVKYAVKLR